MKKIIDNLKKKPQHMREQVAIFAALAITGVVAVFWLSSLSHTYSSQDTKTSFNESISPFKLFGASVRDAFGRTSKELDAVDPSKKDIAEPEVTVQIDERGVVQLGSQSKEDNQ